MHVEPTEHARWNNLARNRNPSPELLEYCSGIGGGMSQAELSALYQLCYDLPTGSTVLHVGVWRGASMCMSLAGCGDSRHIGLDCFDLPCISMMSGNNPATMERTAVNVSPLIRTGQSVEFIKANTLELTEFPRAHLIVIDAGHSQPCIENDSRLARAALEPCGVLAYHDYGSSAWPAIKATVDATFSHGFRLVGTLAIIQPLPTPAHLHELPTAATTA